MTPHKFYNVTGEGAGGTDNRGRKLNYYTVVRIVKETYQVLAIDKDAARLNIQDPASVTIVRETIKLQKPQP